LGPAGTILFRNAVFDYLKDALVNVPLLQAEPGTVLLFDGIFLLRGELINYWDSKIFVKADFRVTLSRALLRDSELFGSEAEIRRRYTVRYIPGQLMYFEECDPESKADLIIDNNDPVNPILREGTKMGAR